MESAHWAQQSNAGNEERSTLAVLDGTPSSIGVVRDSDFDAPDLADWEQLPKTRIIPEKRAASSPYVGGSKERPRDGRTLRRWRMAQPRRGPAYLKIGGRYFYTVGALGEFYERCKRGEIS